MTRDQKIERIAVALGRSVYAGRPSRERDTWLRTYARIMLDELDAIEAEVALRGTDQEDRG